MLAGALMLVIWQILVGVQYGPRYSTFGILGPTHFHASLEA